jgi:hypothetical protein
MTFKNYYQSFLPVAKRFKSYVLSYLPRRLPQGLTEFSDFAQEVLSLSGLPDNDSTRFSLAVMVLHLDSTSSHKPKRYFIRSLQKTAANQVVSQVINDLKEKQAAQQKAAQLKAAATAPEASVDETVKSG